MIQTLAGFSSLLLIAVGWMIGVRLLVLARATRQVPELTMGLGMLLIGASATRLRSRPSASSTRCRS